MKDLVIDTRYGKVHIPLVEGRAAVSASGGADSTILLHILLSHGIHPEVVFIEKTPSSFDKLKQCLSYLEELHGVKLTLKTSVKETSDHNLRPLIIKQVENYDYLYTGVTRNSDKVKGEGAPDRPQSNHSQRIFTPFLEHDKRVPISLYHQFNLKDLLNMTHSCTQDLNRSCQKCYACRERAWAISEVENDL